MFRPDDFTTYWNVNARFADVVRARKPTGDSPLVFVQDYHFALAPQLDARAAAAKPHRHVLAHPVAALAGRSKSARGASICSKDCSAAASSASRHRSIAATSSKPLNGVSARMSIAIRMR